MAEAQDGSYLPDTLNQSTQTTAQQGGGQYAAPTAGQAQTNNINQAQIPNTTANPLQPSYISTPPTGQATTYNAATYNGSYDPSQATSELQQAAGVQSNQQQQALMSMLAAQGISPGSSAAQAAMQNLSTTQQAALDPQLAAVQQYAAGLGQQAGLANASSINSANSQDASSSNQMTLQNLQNLLQQQQFNSTAYNNAGSQQAGYDNQDWLAELNAQLGLQTTGLNGSNSLAGDQAQQQVPLNPSLFSQISSGLGGAASGAAQLIAAGK